MTALLKWLAVGALYQCLVAESSRVQRYLDDMTAPHLKQPYPWREDEREVLHAELMRIIDSARVEFPMHGFILAEGWPWPHVRVMAFGFSRDLATL